MCYFSVGGPNSRQRYGGAKIITFRQIHNAIITLSAPDGGQTPLPTSMWGPWPDLPPGSATVNPKPRWLRHCSFKFFVIKPFSYTSFHCFPNRRDSELLW